MIHSLVQLIDSIFAVRWQGGPPICPGCGGNGGRRSTAATNTRYTCYKCKSTFSLQSDTPLQHARTPLPVIFEVIALHRSGESPHRISRTTGMHHQTVRKFIELDEEHKQWFNAVFKQLGGRT